MNLRGKNSKPDKKREMMEKYDSSAPFYDARYLKIQSEKYEILLKKLNFPIQIVLDAGCGTGLFYQFYTQVTKDMQKGDFIYVGIDLSWGMLGRFMEKIQNNNFNSPNFNLIQCDMENLPFRNASFNLTLSFTSLQNLMNMKKGIMELLRVIHDKSTMMLSILKKKVDLSQLESELINYFNTWEVIKKDNLEDFIIICETKKEYPSENISK